MLSALIGTEGLDPDGDQLVVPMNLNHGLAFVPLD